MRGVFLTAVRLIPEVAAATRTGRAGYFQLRGLRRSASL